MSNNPNSSYVCSCSTDPYCKYSETPSVNITDDASVIIIDIFTVIQTGTWVALHESGSSKDACMAFSQRFII